MEDSDGSITSHQQSIKTASASAAATAATTPATAAAASVGKKPAATRSGSTDSTTSTESSASSTTMTPAARNHQTSSATAKQTTKPEVPVVSNRPRGSIELVAEKKPFQSRFLPNHQTSKKNETESSSSEEETSSEETDDDEEEPTPAKSTATVNGTARDAHTTSAGRSSQSRDTYDHTRRRVSGSGAGYNSPTYGRDSDDSRSAATSSTRTRANAAPHHQNDYDDHSSSRYGSGSSR